MTKNDIAVIIFIIFEFTIVGILNYLDFVNTRKLFCEEEIQNKKRTKIVYIKIHVSMQRKVEENEKNY